MQYIFIRNESISIWNWFVTTNILNISMSIDLIRRETMPLDTIILPIELINYTDDKISITWQLHNNESIDWVAYVVDSVPA